MTPEARVDAALASLYGQTPNPARRREACVQIANEIDQLRASNKALAVELMSMRTTLQSVEEGIALLMRMIPNTRQGINSYECRELVKQGLRIHLQVSKAL